MSPAVIYPSYLLPQPVQAYLSVAEMVEQGRYLLRAIPALLVYDIQDRYVAPELVYPSGSDQLLDYSVNLLGTLQPIDGVWRVPQVGWQPGQIVHPPVLPGQWQPYDWYAVPVSRLRQQPTGHHIAGEAIQCNICHNPTTANYWHCVMRFSNAQGLNIKVLGLSKNGLKRSLADIRSWLRGVIGFQPQQLPSGIAIAPVPLTCCQYAQPDSCPV